MFYDSWFSDTKKACRDRQAFLKLYSYSSVPHDIGRKFFHHQIFLVIPIIGSNIDTNI